MRGLLTSLITVLTLTGLQAQTLPATPKLVVGLTVDQLRTDYIEAYSSLYGEKGFKRLWREARVYRNAEYNFTGADRASAVAAIYSGTSPSKNGIVANQWLDASTLRPVYCVDDAAFMGYFTSETTSPSLLLTSTLADELKMATDGKALVYSIAPFRDSAVFGAGHAGNGAFWLNDMTGKWCGTTYYGEFPWWVSQYNDKSSVDIRISGITWTPLLPLHNYINLSDDQTKNSFRYKFDDAKRNKFKRLAGSPFVNDEINLLVEDFLTHSTIGRDDTPDLLALTFYAGNYTDPDVQTSALEVQDTYTRLDRSIGDLLDMLDKKVGLQNVLFFITSTGYTDGEPAERSTYRIPGGEFYPNRCAALLNMYLMATYGDGQYVEAHHGTEIYLNSKLIEQKQLSPVEVQTKAADFLIQFSGVDDVYSSYRLLLGSWTPEIEKYRNAYHRKRSGDLVIQVLPGWTITHENNLNNKTVRHSYVPVPILFMGNSIKPEIIETPVTTDHIAPTLSYYLRIRAPNACTAKPLTYIR